MHEKALDYIKITVSVLKVYTMYSQSSLISHSIPHSLRLDVWRWWFRLKPPPRGNGPICQRTILASLCSDGRTHIFSERGDFDEQLSVSLDDWRERRVASWDADLRIFCQRFADNGRVRDYQDGWPDIVLNWCTLRSRVLISSVRMQSNAMRKLSKKRSKTVLEWRRLSLPTLTILSVRRKNCECKPVFDWPKQDTATPKKL